MKLREPRRADGPVLHRLVAQCPPLDLNSPYLYLLLGEHFAATCIVAEDAAGVAGMVSGYRLPERSGAWFVWQVAVHPRMRGQGLGQRMLRAVLARPAMSDVRCIETTVGPGNRASRRLFSGLAESLDAPLVETALFDAALFEDGAHEAEPLLRIGPFTLPQATRTAAAAIPPRQE